jgi:hypothetical protein
MVVTPHGHGPIPIQATNVRMLTETVYRVKVRAKANNYAVLVMRKLMKEFKKVVISYTFKLKCIL